MRTSSKRSDISPRTWLDDTELLIAAECYDVLAETCRKQGDTDGESANKDTAATLRHIAGLCVERGKPQLRGRLEFRLPVILIEIHGTTTIKEGDDE